MDGSSDLNVDQDSTESQLRPILLTEVQRILEDHRLWLESKGSEGIQADFTGKRLIGVTLQGANLRKSILRHAHLDGVDFSDADLEDADLSEAMFQECVFKGAILRRAKLRAAHFHRKSTESEKQDLRGADLTDVDLSYAKIGCTDFSGAILERANLSRCTGVNVEFKDAVLTGADLSDCQHLDKAIGLTQEHLAGVNLSGARIREDIAQFKGLEHAREISQQAKKVFFAVIGACVFCWLTSGTSTDVGLLLNKAATPLPVIQTAVPIATFYLIAPAVLLCLYAYLHLYLQSLWTCLSRLPAYFPDGRTLDQRAYPWLVTSLVRANVPMLKENLPPYAHLQLGISIASVWYLVPLTILWFWYDYFRAYSLVGNWWLLALAVTSAFLGADSYRLAVSAFRSPDVLRKGPRSRNPFELFKQLFSSGFVFRIWMLGLGICATLTLLTQVSYPDVRVLFRGAHLREAVLSERPGDWYRLSQDQLFRATQGARLATRNLRGADLSGAFLMKADLEEVDLDSARLNVADLRGSNLRGATLRGAQLRRALLNLAFLGRAHFEGADLSYASLDGAVLQGAALEGAKLEGAQLQGADLSRTCLRGASLKGANLKGAVLEGSNLRGATLEGVSDLTQAQLDAACGDGLTRLPAGLSVRKCPSTPTGNQCR
jgi:uncharacterized protein YjbI with pentapeptide repeats